MSNSPIDPSDPLVQLIHTLVQLFKPLYTTLIVGCIWSAMLIPLLAVLLSFSNRETRRKPVFIANVLSIMIGLTLAGVIIVLIMSSLLNPLAPPNVSLCLTFATFIASSSLAVESVLLIRLWAVYPYRTTPRRTFIAIFVPIMLLKLARLSNLMVYLVNLSNMLRGGQNTLLLLQKVWTKFPSYKIEWFLHVVDNTSASVLFLVKLNEGRGFRSRGQGWSSTLEALFWITISNFVIPVILSIAQLAIVWTSSDIFTVVPVCLVNIYVEIIGVLLATVWAGGAQWGEEGRIRSGLVLTTVTVGMDTNRSSVEAKR